MLLSLRRGSSLLPRGGVRAYVAHPKARSAAWLDIWGRRDPQFT